VCSYYFIIYNDGLSRCAVQTACRFEFFVAENVESVDIHKRLFVVYGNEILDVSFVRRWVLLVKGF